MSCQTWVDGERCPTQPKQYVVVVARLANIWDFQRKTQLVESHCVTSPGSSQQGPLES